MIVKTIGICGGGFVKEVKKRCDELEKEKIEEVKKW